MPQHPAHPEQPAETQRKLKAGCTLVVKSLNVTQGASILGTQGPNPNAGGQQLATSYITTITP